MTTTGTTLGPQYGPNVVESESSGRKCVKLAATGQYVEFAAQAAANTIVVRYSVPDSGNGTGIDSTISLYKNGVFVQKLPVTSKYSWLYGGYPFSNTPQYSPRNFYDEVRLKGLSISPGDVVRIQKDANDTATYCVVDLVDLENIAGPLAKPAGDWLTITDPPYNAVGNGTTDATAALQNCINDARTQGKNVWVPAGNYLITADINNLQNITIQGAGMWHTTFVGSPTLYTMPGKRVRFNGGGSNIHFADFAIVGKLNYRGDDEANDGFSEFFGTGSTISRIWVEHTKTGAWIANSSGLVIEGCRIRNTIADGINLCVGVRSSTITNCTTRGTGDDCFAMWPATYAAQTYKPGLNVISHCTAQLPFLANGAAIYGGESNRIEDSVFKDLPYGCGILISGTFPVGANTFTGTTVIQRNDLLRCGGYDPAYQWRAALQFTMEQHPIANVTLSDLNIVDSISDGISVIAENTLSNATITNLNLPNFGIGALGRHGLWAKANAHGSLAISNSTVAEYKSDSSSFTFNFTNVTFPTNAIPAVPTALTASKFDVQGGKSQITLSWMASQGAKSYKVKRATASGGPYALVASPTTSGYVDVGLNSATAYYYVVSAVNDGGESANSSQATPPAANGALTFSSGTFGDNTVLNLLGDPSRALYGVSLGNATARTTANGYTFGAYPNGNISYSGPGAGTYGGFLGSGTSGDANFNPVLNSAVLGLDNGTLTLKNLTAGNTYNVLFIEVDARDGMGTRTFNITSGTTQSPNQPYAFQAGTPALLGGYVLCTFTATGPTQVFTTAAQNTYQLNAILVGTADPGSPPAAPPGLAATGGNLQVLLNWTVVSGAASYNVKRAAVSGGPYTVVATGVTGASYADGGLTNGTTYYYVVSAVNGSGEGANSGQASAAPFLTIPAVPSGLAASAGNAQVALSWTASSGAASYNVKRSTVSGGPYTTVGSPAAASYSDATAANGTTYYYVVSAINSVGESGNSAPVSATPAVLINRALSRPVTTSSVADNGPGANAVDGNASTRWSSAYSDPQWISVDLGAAYDITRVKLTWEAAYGKAYEIQVSPDAAAWTSIYSTTTGTGGVNDLTGLSGSGRYVRMYGTVRGTGYGYSLWEFEVYGTPASSGPSAVSVTATDATAQKGTSDTGVFTFTRTGSTAGALAVSFGLSTGETQAVQGADYSISSAPPAITIPAGQTSAQAVVTPIDREKPTGSLPVTVTLEAGTGYTIGASGTAAVQIQDSAINQWKIAQFGLAAAQSALAQDTADADADGESNLCEFALGHSPLASPDGARPEGKVETIGGISCLTYDFSRPRPNPVGITYGAETSSSLNGVDWTAAVPVAGYPLDLGNGMETMKFRSIHPANPLEREFIRLRVTRQ